MKKMLALILIIIFPISCMPIAPTIAKYNEVADQVNLGDSKEKVLAILLPTQKELGPGYNKAPDKYLKDNKLVEIYFMRSGWQPDGLTTDDEFTPYIFHDGKLVGIGWSMIGGSKSQGQAPPVHY